MSSPGHQQVLAHRDFRVEVVLLRNDPEARLDTAGLPLVAHAEHPELPAGHRRGARNHAHGRGFPGAVRAEKPERLSRAHVVTDAVDSSEIPEPFRQSARLDQRRVV
jgi:hypothetical protein